jgi:uncharacterized YigZ family protein
LLFADSYFTITAPSTGIFKDRGSKFLAFVYAVKTEKEIKQHLLTLKKEHPSARHHCYAWRLGADKIAFRANDDGEPSSSAGKPILGQIQANDLTDVLIVVIRYFGGTLLGVNGLINAYKNAAADAIANTQREEKFIFFEYKIEFDFDTLNAVMRLLKEYEAKIISNNYDTKNRILFQIRKKDAEGFENKAKELYTCKLEFLHLA